jgi:type III secretion system-like peptide-binding chaperone
VSEPVGLFENQREANLASTIAMIEDVLLELGHFLNDCRIDPGGHLRAWRVVKGSATIHIALIARDDFTHLRVASSVMTCDDRVDRRALFAHLLALNGDLCGAAFALRGDEIHVVAERSTLDLDRSEVADVIGRVQSYADDHDDLLVARYGGTLGGTAS